MTFRVCLTSCLLVAAAGICLAAEQNVLPEVDIVSSRPSAEFQAMQLQARQESDDPRAREWSGEATKRLSGLLGPLLQGCRQGLTSMPTVTALIQMDASGKARKVLVSDNSPYGTCVARSLQSLNLGSSPWDGHWQEVRLQGFTMPPRLFTIVEGSCKPGGDAPATPAINIVGVSPAAGTALARDSVVSLSLAFSVPAAAGQYMIEARLDTTAPRRYLSEWINFTLPATCVTRGTFTAEFRPELYWSAQELGDSFKLTLMLVEGTQRTYYPLANSRTVEHPRKDDGAPRRALFAPQ